MNQPKIEITYSVESCDRVAAEITVYLPAKNYKIDLPYRADDTLLDTTSNVSWGEGREHYRLKSTTVYAPSWGELGEIVDEIVLTVIEAVKSRVKSYNHLVANQPMGREIIIDV